MDNHELPHSTPERRASTSNLSCPPVTVSGSDHVLAYPYHGDGPLRKVHPYSHTYLTYAKERWLERTILDVFVTEFRDRSKDFYEWAISTGTVMVNGNVVDCSYVMQNGDLISNVIHRHEPPILGGRVQVYHRDDVHGIWVVEKKASMPIHTTGRYRKNTLLEVLKNEYGLESVHTANRLDRLVSGIMIISTTKAGAQVLGSIFQTPGAVKKEYVARVAGEFQGDGDVVCKQPLLTIDRQIGINVVHPDGRPSETIFSRLSYDPLSNTSVVRCRPLTGRSHQLRVHLQYLGHPIANDPIYNNATAWGQTVGKGGVFPEAQQTHESSATDGQGPNNETGEHIDMQGSTSKVPEAGQDSSEPSHLRQKRIKQARSDKWEERRVKTQKPSLRVEGELRSGSEVALVPQAVHAITELRKVRDEEDNFSRYKDMERPVALSTEMLQATLGGNEALSSKGRVKTLSKAQRENLSGQAIEVPNLRELQLANPEYYISQDEKGQYCNVCGTPLLPDPKPEQLCIWLHAIRYHTDEWDYSSPLPTWARENWQSQT